MINLQNDKLSVKIAALGAELQQLQLRHTQTNYLWSGNPHFWGKFSPILFPIVGALKQNTYYYRNKAYQLSRHGFARERVFDVLKTSPQQVVFQLKDDEQSRLCFPFAFELKVKYELLGPSLKCTYEVNNPSATDVLWFSLGAHPAFAVPLAEQGQYQDYYLQFENDTNLQTRLIQDNLLSKNTRAIALDQGKLRLNHALFYQDALVFDGLNSKKIQLKNCMNNKGLDFEFVGFPYFGIWAAIDANFVCLEPWSGVADDVQHNQQLEEKEGMVQLSPGASYLAEWKVTCY